MWSSRPTVCVEMQNTPRRGELGSPAYASLAKGGGFCRRQKTVGLVFGPAGCPAAKAMQSALNYIPFAS